MTSARAIFLVAAFSLGLSGCIHKTTVRYVDLKPPTSIAHEIAEEDLLDIGVAVFNSNIPEEFDTRVRENISPEIREAEANYIAYFLKDLLQSTGNWGAVRVIPRPSFAVDITVTGQILHSDGERLIMAVEVKDASGAVWLDQTFETLASKYAYEPSIPVNIDPFQSAYKEVANQMLDYQQNLSTEDVQAIRRIAELKFARSFSKEAFSNHVSEPDKKGISRIVRLPADDDPMLRRIRDIRQREYAFIDTLDEYFADFNRKMYRPYQDWRSGTYQSAIDFREARNRARARLLTGTAMVVSGAVMQRSNSRLTEYSGYANVIGGAGYMLGSIRARTNMDEHANALREIGISASAAISPHTIELENSIVALEGSATEQYDLLRQVLRKLYYQDLGVPIPQEVSTEPQLAGTQSQLEQAGATAEELRALEVSLESSNVSE